MVIKYWKPISAFFKDLFAPVVQAFKGVWNWITNLWEKAQNIFNGIKEWVKDSWVGKAWNWAFGDDEDTHHNQHYKPLCAQHGKQHGGLYQVRVKGNWLWRIRAVGLGKRRSDNPAYESNHKARKRATALHGRTI